MSASQIKHTADDHSNLLLELEEYANKSISELKKIEDHLALGLGYKHLGIALYYNSKDTDEAYVRHEKAVAALKESIKLLQETGYHRGAVDAFLCLGKCNFSLWEHTGEHDYLVDSIRSLNDGILSTTVGLGKKENLIELYKSLEIKIKNLL